MTRILCHSPQLVIAPTHRSSGSPSYRHFPAHCARTGESPVKALAIMQRLCKAIPLRGTGLLQRTLHALRAKRLLHLVRARNRRALGVRVLRRVGFTVSTGRESYVIVGEFTPAAPGLRCHLSDGTRAR